MKLQNQRSFGARDVFKMSVPIFIELLLQMLVGNVDQFMVSRISQSSVAAIGNGNQLMNIVIILLNVLAGAATVVLSQSIGARDTRGVSQVCTVSTLVMALGGLAATAVLVLGNGAIFGFLGVPADVLGEARAYTMIVGSFVLVQGLYMNFAAILRSYGMVKEVMAVSAVMNLCNIAGNAVLINGLLGFPRLGAVGAAISTDLSKCVGLALVYLMFRRRTGVRMSAADLKPFPTGTLRRLLFIGLPSAGQELSYNLSQMTILKFVNLFGTAVIAAKVYCSMLANVAYIYSMAISQATQIIIGYLAGAGDHRAIPRRVWSTTAVSTAVSLAVTALLFAFARPIFGLFTADAAVIELGRRILLIEFVLEIGRSVNIVMVRCLVAVGDVNFPVGLGIFSMWGVSVLGGWFFGVHLGMGLVGIWWAMAADECLRAVIFLFRFGSGVWKKKLAGLGGREEAT